MLAPCPAALAFCLSVPLRLFLPFIYSLTIIAPQDRWAHTLTFSCVHTLTYTHTFQTWNSLEKLPCTDKAEPGPKKGEMIKRMGILSQAGGRAVRVGRRQQPPPEMSLPQGISLCPCPCSPPFKVFSPGKGFVCEKMWLLSRLSLQRSQQGSLGASRISVRT